MCSLCTPTVLFCLQCEMHWAQEQNVSSACPQFVSVCALFSWTGREGPPEIWCGCKRDDINPWNSPCSLLSICDKRDSTNGRKHPEVSASWVCVYMCAQWYVCNVYMYTSCYSPSLTQLRLLMLMHLHPCLRIYEGALLNSVCGNQCCTPDAWRRQW